MGEYVPLKHHFGANLAQLLGEQIARVHRPFQTAALVHEVAQQVENLELKDRVKAIAVGLRKHLPSDYSQALRILLQILGPELTATQGMFNDGYQYMPVARFVEEYGVDHFDESLRALREITKRHTAEYAIRPFLVRYPDRCMKVLRQWATDESFHVRRLVSEGTRSRLPWASSIASLRENPGPVIRLLELLKDDPSTLVQKSVANNLNDISKDHPARAIQVARDWLQGKPGKNTRWIVHHALRTLIKAGDPEAFEVLGLSVHGKVDVTNLTLVPRSGIVLDELTFSFEISNRQGTSQELMVDYILHMPRASKKIGTKVFKLKRIILSGGGTVHLEKKHSFHPTTTRRYYSGSYRVEIQVNGVIKSGIDFQLRVR